ncbi:MAG: NAD-dependent dehydratase, partial [Actinobacteria bacterium]|nr:NAD-dependent dehydratase [Actinomycetota bacterium]
MRRFSETAANEFIRGDLTDQILVEKIVQFKGYAGNYYHFVPSK